MPSDLGVLLPTESQYGNPGAYTEAIRAESNKQATYLSNMDQFYAQLDESKRQFDLNYSAREKEFDWTKGFEEKKLAHQTTIDTRKLELQEKEAELMRQIKEKELQFAETQLGFQKEQLGFEREKLTAELEKMRQEIGLAERGMALEEKLGMSRLDVEQEGLALQKQLGLGQLNLSRYQTNAEIGLKKQELNFTQGLQLAQFSAGLNQAYPGGVPDYSTAKMPGQIPKSVPTDKYFGLDKLSQQMQQSQANYNTYTPKYTSQADSAYARLYYK